MFVINGSDFFISLWIMPIKSFIFALNKTGFIKSNHITIYTTN